jgi:hypothetical protein
VRFGISFSPAGLLTPFHIGASTCLNDLGCLTSEVALAGASGGALAAVITALLSEYPAHTFPISPMEASVFVAQQCRELGPRGTLRQALDHMLLQLIPDDAHDKFNNRIGSVKIAYTSFSREAGFRSNHIDFFTDKIDLINCLRASCNIPLYFDGNAMFVKVREEYGIDGIFSVDFRRFGCPSTNCTERELIISPFPPPYVNIQPYLVRPKGSMCEYDIITPALLDRKLWPFSPTEILRMALNAPKSSTNPSKSISDEELKEKYNILFQAGYEAARRWYTMKGHKDWKTVPKPTVEKVDGSEINK